MSSSILIEGGLPFFSRTISSALEMKEAFLSAYPDVDEVIAELPASAERFAVILRELMGMHPSLCRIVVERIRDVSTQSVWLYYLVDQFIAADDIAQAREIAETILDDTAQSISFNMVIDALIKKREFVQAVELVEQMKDEGMKEMAFVLLSANLIESQANSQDCVRVRQCAQGIRNEESKSWGLFSVVRALILREDFAEASKTIEEISLEEAKSKALCELVTARTREEV